MKLSVLSEHVVGQPLPLAEGFMSMFGGSASAMIPPRYWQKIDARVIKTLVTAISMNDIRWALGQVANILDPQDLVTFKDALKNDAKGSLARIRKEANDVMITYGRKAAY